jgi:GNAT superfamily N-acetyltransferase
MLLRFDADPSAYLGRLSDHDETETFGVLRIAQQLVSQTRTGALLALDVEGDAVVGMAAWTPPWPLTIPRWPAARLPELIAAARAHAELGSVVTTEALADVIVDLHREPTRRLGLVFQVLTAVTPPTPGPGARRFATEDDVPLLTDWIPRFLREVKLPLHGDPIDTARYFVRSGRMHLWIEDDRPMACTAHFDFGCEGTHLGLVYTPPELRGRGRASRLVAAVSRHALDRGRRHLTLYTDEDNPTSNAIYRRLGYVERYRHVELGFEGEVRG